MSIGGFIPGDHQSCFHRRPLAALLLRGNGKSYYLQGLKENVITGNLIPAGTGERDFDDWVVGSKEDFDLLLSNREVGRFDEEE